MADLSSTVSLHMIGEFGYNLGRFQQQQETGGKDEVYHVARWEGA